MGNVPYRSPRTMRKRTPPKSRQAEQHSAPGDGVELPLSASQQRVGANSKGALRQTGQPLFFFSFRWTNIITTQVVVVVVVPPSRTGSKIKIEQVYRVQGIQMNSLDRKKVDVELELETCQTVSDCTSVCVFYASSLPLLTWFGISFPSLHLCNPIQHTQLL